MVVVSCKTNYFPCGKAHIQELHGTNYASFRESMFNSIFEGEKAEKGYIYIYINKNHRCCDFPQFSMPCHAMSPQLLQLLLQQGIGTQDLGEPREPSMYDDDAGVNPLVSPI